MARFLLDNDLPYRLAHALQALEGEHGHEVRPIREVYGEDAQDLDFLPKLGREGWILVSKDRRQTRRPAEREARQKARVTALYFGPFFGRIRFWEQAAFVVRYWPALASWAETSTPGTVGIIQQNGKVKAVPE
jgi:hypothetical protein